MPPAHKTKKNIQLHGGTKTHEAERNFGLNWHGCNFRAFARQAHNVL